MAIPTLPTLRDTYGITAEDAPDAVLQAALDAEVEAQQGLVWPSVAPYTVTVTTNPDGTTTTTRAANADHPAQLQAALERRVARNLAARAIPLGLVDSGDGIARTLPTWDAEIGRWERPLARMVAL